MPSGSRVVSSSPLTRSVTGSSLGVSSRTSWARGRMAGPIAPPSTPPPTAPITPPNPVSIKLSLVSGLSPLASCSTGFWTSSSAPSIAPPLTAPEPIAFMTVVSASIPASCLRPASEVSLSAQSCGPNLVSIMPTVAAPKAAIALSLKSPAAVGSFSICLPRIPPNDGRAATSAGPPQEINCPPAATTGAAGPASGEAAVMAAPNPRIPSIVPTEPIALPDASATVVPGFSRISPNPWTLVGLASMTSWP